MKINQCVFDSENKEYVRISNGIPKTDAGGKETSELTPTEAIALRVFMVDDKPRIAFTYRKVKESFLSPLDNEAVTASYFDSILQGEQVNKHYNFIGRV